MTYASMKVILLQCFLHLFIPKVAFTTALGSLGFFYNLYRLSSFFTLVYKGQTPTLMHPLYRILACSWQEILFL